MFIKGRKKGFSFIQSIITLFLILLVFNLCLIFINYNYSKGRTFRTYSDIKTLSYEEEEFLVIINKNINDFISLNQVKIKELKRENVNLANYNFEIINNKYYMTKRKDNNKMYIELEEITNESYSMFNPKYYKTEYIVGAAKDDK